MSAEQAAALDYDSALALVDAVCVAVEWVDVRWRDGTKAPALALLADGQCHGGLALGEWLPASVIARRDWGQQLCTVTVNGGSPQRFTGTHSLGGSGLAAGGLAAACGARIWQRACRHPW